MIRSIAGNGWPYPMVKPLLLLLLGKIMGNAGTGVLMGKSSTHLGFSSKPCFIAQRLRLGWLCVEWFWDDNASSGMVAHLTEEPLLEELLGSSKAMKEHAKAEKVSSCSWLSQPRYASFVLCIFAMKRTWS